MCNKRIAALRARCPYKLAFGTTNGWTTIFASSHFKHNHGIATDWVNTERSAHYERLQLSRQVRPRRVHQLSLPRPDLFRRSAIS